MPEYERRSGNDRYDDRRGGNDRYDDRRGGNNRYDDRRGGNEKYDDRRSGNDRYDDRRGGNDRYGDRGNGNYRPSRPSHDTRNERYNNNRYYRDRGGDRDDRGDSLLTYKPRYDDRQQTGRQRVPTQDSKPKLTKEEEIERCEKKLANLQKVPNIEDITIIDSKWGVKPKGFENVTAQRAKLSGLFPLPGYPRPVDFTKLEGVARDRLLNSNDILNGSSKIDPIDSRNSSILFIKNINFGIIDYLKVTEYFNKFLSQIDIPETTLNNVESKRKTKDDQNLIIEFKNNTCATIAMALNSRKLSFNEMKLVKNDDEGNPIHQIGQDTGDDIVLDISRPGEYVVQCLPPYSEIKEDEIEESVTDSPRKITVLVPSTLDETELIKNIKEVGTIKGFQMLREIGTKKSLGIAFLEFYIDPTKYQKTINAIPVIQTLVEDLKQSLFIEDAFFSCIIPDHTSIQDCPIDLSTLKKLVKNEHVTTHPSLRVIQLINIVTAKDLMDDASFKFIQKDIQQEVSKFGNLKTIKIPRPANDYTPGISQFTQPGLGKIYIEFDDEETALNAIMGLAGRMYNDRTVLCSFYDYDDFKNGLL